MSKATLAQKAMRTVFVGQRHDNSLCGHQHLTSTKARNCIDNEGKVMRLTVKARRELAQ